MLQSQWLAIAGAATLFTFAWLFVERRITTTTGVATGLWAICAMSAGEVEVLTDSGTRVAVDATQLQYIALALATLSMLAAILHRTGTYPPRDAESHLNDAGGTPADD